MSPQGYGYGRGGRGRCRRQRWIEHTPNTLYFKPFPNHPPFADDIILTRDELEILRLVNIEELTQEEAARRIGISRKTLWTDLQRARKKITTALIHGYGIRIQGDAYTQEK